MTDDRFLLGGTFIRECVWICLKTCVFLGQYKKIGFSPTLLLGIPLGAEPDPLEAERGESSGDPVPTELGRLSGIQASGAQITYAGHVSIRTIRARSCVAL